MIDEICVHDIALIEEASIEPAAGLTAITGETGAGKTALLHACRLLSGQRGDKTMVREGAPEASVSGRFFMPGPHEMEEPSAAALASDREVAVVRRMGADGRSRVKIDGQIATVGELSDLIAPLIDLCSQHDQQALLHKSAHRDLLDLFAGPPAQDAREAYADAFNKARRAKAHLDEILEARRSSDAKLEEARFVLSQIDPVDPSLADYEELTAFVRRSENAEVLARTSNEAHEELCQEGGALDGLNAAIALIEEGARYDGSLQAHADSLRDAIYIAEDVAREVLRYRDAIDLDMSTLDQCQARVSEYQGLIRRYGPSLEDVIRCADEARRTVSMMEDSEGAESAARAALDEAEDGLAQAARVLHEARAEAAPRLAQDVQEVMVTLQMGSASIECAPQMQERAAWTESGPDEVELMFKPSSNMSARPLSKVASGGELSRIMLALHVILGEKGSTSTLIFDEIDAGVGGAVANALAEVIARLAQTHQVIVVTHLAQVASRADRHYVVSKAEEGGVASTSIKAVSADARISEIARMLSGSESEASLAHARELLEQGSAH